MLAFGYLIDPDFFDDTYAAAQPREEDATAPRTQELVTRAGYGLGMGTRVGSDRVRWSQPPAKRGHTRSTASGSTIARFPGRGDSPGARGRS